MEFCIDLIRISRTGGGAHDDSGVPRLGLGVFVVFCIA